MSLTYPHRTRRQFHETDHTHGYLDVCCPCCPAYGRTVRLQQAGYRMEYITADCEVEGRFVTLPDRPR